MGVLLGQGVPVRRLSGERDRIFAYLRQKFIGVFQIKGAGGKLGEGGFGGRRFFPELGSQAVELLRGAGIAAFFQSCGDVFGVSG